MPRPRPGPTPDVDDTCHHCGVRGRIQLKSNVTVKRYVDGDFQQGAPVYDTIVGVYVCEACQEPTILRYVWSSDTLELFDQEQVHPTARDNSALPKNVRQRLESANRVRKVDPSFYAVGIGRMLEAVCNEEQAAGTTLSDKLGDLAKQNRIPGPLADVAQHLRVLRNFGAHDAEVEVAPEDVPVIEDFADAILEYLYRAPAKLAAVQSGLKQRKKKAAKRT